MLQWLKNLFSKKPTTAQNTESDIILVPEPAAPVVSEEVKSKTKKPAKVNEAGESPKRPRKPKKPKE